MAVKARPSVRQKVKKESPLWGLEGRQVVPAMGGLVVPPRLLPERRASHNLIPLSMVVPTAKGVSR